MSVYQPGVLVAEGCFAGAAVVTGARRLAQQLGCRFYRAATVESALAQLRRVPVDVLLLGLPHQGPELCQRVKAEPSWRSAFALLSTDLYGAAVRDCYSAGADAMVHYGDDLLAYLQLALALRRDLWEGRWPAPRHYRPGLLLVGDVGLSWEMVFDAACNRCQVYRAATEDWALWALGQASIDLMMMGWGVDGVGLCRHIKQSPPHIRVFSLGSPLFDEALCQAGAERFCYPEESGRFAAALMECRDRMATRH
jgi:CheY-like chemotaxis protein